MWTCTPCLGLLCHVSTLALGERRFETCAAEFCQSRCSFQQCPLRPQPHDPRGCVQNCLSWCRAMCKLPILQIKLNCSSFGNLNTFAQHQWVCLLVELMQGRHGPESRSPTEPTELPSCALNRQRKAARKPVRNSKLAIKCGKLQLHEVCDILAAWTGTIRLNNAPLCTSQASLFGIFAMRRGSNILNFRGTAGLELVGQGLKPFQQQVGHA